MENILDLAAANQQRAREVIRNQAGSRLAGGGRRTEPRGVAPHGPADETPRHRLPHLLPSLNIADSFAAMTRIAANPRIRRIEYGNLLDAPDQCLEWHAWYADADDRLWQIDAIHMARGSAWEGYSNRWPTGSAPC